MIKCKKCGEEKPLNEMRKKSSCKTGYLSMCKACQSKQRVKNGEYLREVVRRHAKRAGQRVPHVKVDDLADIYKAYPDCAYCGVILSDDNKSIDHVYPVSSEYGGKHVGINLVACCISCNSSKHTSNIYDFYQRSEKFNDKLWRKFLKTWIGRMSGREITEQEVDEMTFHMKAESEEISEWLASQIKPLDKAN